MDLDRLELLPDHQQPTFVDLLQKLKVQSDFSWAIRPKAFPRYVLAKDKAPNAVKRQVLENPLVRECVSQQALRRNTELKVVETEALAFVNQMGHSFSLPTVRFVGYILKKVMQSLFSGIYVNHQQLDSIRLSCIECPTILLPTHRTYLDFLLISFIFFHYDITLPAIASATDFLGMDFIANILRRCGAFFVRRGNHDALYWTILTVYTQQLLLNGDQSVLVFPEGTRSRTGKPLHPRTGMLSMLLEPFFRREIYDVLLVPISVSYSKVLEDAIYAYELLGFKKPPESTSGLVRARRILRETNLGDVYIHFGHAISCRDYFADLLAQTASVRSLRPLVDYQPGPVEHAAVKRLAHVVSERQRRSSVCSVWTLACCVLLQEFDSLPLAAGAMDRQVSFDILRVKTQQLYDMTKAMFCETDAQWPSKMIWLSRNSFESELRYWIQFHAHLVCLVRRCGVADPAASASAATTTTWLQLRSIQSAAVSLDARQSSAAATAVNVPLPTDIIGCAVPMLMLAGYANHGIASLFSDLATLSVVYLASIEVNSMIVLLDEFRWLKHLLNFEFISTLGNEEADFKLSQRLLRCVGISLNDSLSIDSGAFIAIGKLEFFGRMIKPFLTGYWLLCQSLVYGASDERSNAAALSEFAVCRNAQILAAGLVRRGEASPLVLSLDLLRNGVRALTALGVLQKRILPASDNAKSAAKEFSVNRTLLTSTIARLERYLGTVSKPLNRLPAVVLLPKL